MFRSERKALFLVEALGKSSCISSGFSRRNRVYMLSFFAFLPIHGFPKSDENMRLRAIQDDQQTDTSLLEYLNFPLNSGEGKQKQTEDSLTELRPSVHIVESSTSLFESVFPNFKGNYNDVQWRK